MDIKIKLRESLGSYNPHEWSQGAIVSPLVLEKAIEYIEGLERKVKVYSEFADLIRDHIEAEHLRVHVEDLKVFLKEAEEF